MGDFLFLAALPGMGFCWGLAIVLICRRAERDYLRRHDERRRR